MVHRKLTRTAKHHDSLLRNLVTNVLEHESITTTHAKAKEAQTAVERAITAAKHLNETRGDTLRATQRLQNRFYKPDLVFPKLMGELRQRYADFNGGYTRILKLEPRVGDNAPQSILELVNGNRDMRMAITAKAVARCEALGEPLNGITEKNVRKICQRSPEMEQRFRQEVQSMKEQYFANIDQGKQDFIANSLQRKRKAPIKLMPNPLATSTTSSQPDTTQ